MLVMDQETVGNPDNPRQGGKYVGSYVANGSGTLDNDEITGTEYVCNGGSANAKGGLLLVGLAWGLEARSPRTGAALWTFRANHLTQGIPVLSQSRHLVLVAEWGGLSLRMMKLAALALCLAPAAGVERRSSLVWTCGPQ